MKIDLSKGVCTQEELDAAPDVYVLNEERRAEGYTHPMICPTCMKMWLSNTPPQPGLEEITDEIFEDRSLVAYRICPPCRPPRNRDPFGVGEIDDELFDIITKKGN